jgi:hypothetical protein
VEALFALSQVAVLCHRTFWARLLIAPVLWLVGGAGTPASKPDAHVSDKSMVLDVQSLPRVQVPNRSLNGSFVLCVEVPLTLCT